MASTLPTPFSCCSTFSQLTSVCDISELVGSGGGSSTSLAVDTVVDLRLVDSHVDRQIAWTRGWLDPEDGQGSQYYYWESSVVADDNFNWIKPANVSGAGRWVRAGVTP